MRGFRYTDITHILVLGASRLDAALCLALSAPPSSDSQPDASASTAELPEAEISPPRRLRSRRPSALLTCAAARALQHGQALSPDRQRSIWI
jgi:hypothetical protein